VEFNVGSVGQRGVVRKVVGSSTRLLRSSAHQVGDHDCSSLCHIPTPSSRRASASLNPPRMGPERGRSWPHLRSPSLAHPHPLRRSQRIWSSVGELLEVPVLDAEPSVHARASQTQSAFGGQLCQLLQEDFARALPLGSCHSSPCAPRATCAATSAHLPSSCTISTSPRSCACTTTVWRVVQAKTQRKAHAPTIVGNCAAVVASCCAKRAVHLPTRLLRAASWR
jgi:hypothetical protein